jgi:UDP-N-acetyl-2-amino-2-deoxyglucuronate dehydrogenase
MSIAVAIVGSGIIGANHAAAVLRHPGLHLAAVVDTDDAARRRLADRVAGEWGAPPPAQFDSLAAALAAGGFDLVAVCTPSGLHADLAEQALAAGRHVLVEKPLDASLSRARKLVAVAEEAERRGVLSTVVSQHRFDPASAAVAKAVADGRLGRITSAVASVAWWRAQDYYDSADWRGTCALDGGGALMNQGVHTVDLLCWLLGRPVEVYAHTARLAHEGIEVEDVAVATVRFESGALAALHATTAAYPGLAVRLQVHGDAGSAVLHDDQLEYFHAAATGSGDNDDSGSATSGAALRPRAVAGGPLGGAEPDNQAAAVVPAQELRGSAKPADTFVLGHLRQYQDVVSAIEDRRPPAVTLAEGLTAMAVVHAVYESAAAHKPVEVS